MGILEDMVKLQFGRPMQESLVAIGQANREERIQQEWNSLIQDPASAAGKYRVALQDSTLTPDERNRAATGALNALFQLPGASQTVVGGTIANSILQGAKAATEGYSAMAQGKLQMAQAGEISAETTSLDSRIPLSAGQKAALTKQLGRKSPTGEPLLAGANMLLNKVNEGSLTYREFLNLSKAYSPFLQLESDRLRVGLAKDQLKTKGWEFMTGFLLPSLGWMSTDMPDEVRQSIDKFVDTGDMKPVIEGITNTIWKRVQEKPEGDRTLKSRDQVYEAVRDRVIAAQKKFGDVLAVQAAALDVEKAKIILGAMAPSETGEVPTAHSVRKAAEVLGVPDPTQPDERDALLKSILDENIRLKKERNEARTRAGIKENDEKLKEEKESRPSSGYGQPAIPRFSY